MAAPIIVFSGTSGRLRTSAAYALNAAGDLPDLTTPGTAVAIATITSWKLSISVSGGELLTFESPTDAFRVLYPLQLQGGVGKWSGSVAGVFDGDTVTSAAMFPPGAFLLADFILFKVTTAGPGFKNAIIKIGSFDIGADMKPDASTFAVNFMGHGALPAYG